MPFEFAFKCAVALRRSRSRKNLAVLQKLGIGRGMWEPGALPAPKSDTLFILASGGSINDITEEQWKHIGERDSLGMNFWLLHPFVPDLHMWEMPRSPIHARQMSKAFEVRANDYAKTPSILKGTYVDQPLYAEMRQLMPESMLKRLAYCEDFAVSARSVDEFKQALHILRKEGMLVPNSSLRPMPHPRASLGWAIALGFKRGHKKVVILGADMSNTSYFYVPRQAELEAQGFEVPDHGQRGVVHKTNDPEVNPVTMSDVIMLLQTEVFGPAGGQIYLGFEGHPMADRLPVYRWGED